MAISRKTQKDIGQYEPKFIGPFTGRQSAAVGIGGALCFATCYVLKQMNLDAMTMFMICALIIIPFFVFGWIKPYGLKVEDFIKEYYHYHYISPHIRPYETVTGLDTVEWNDPEKKNEDGKNKKQAYVHKKNKDYPEYL